MSRRTTVIILVLCLCALILSGCGGDQPIAATVGTSEPTTIVPPSSSSQTSQIEDISPVEEIEPVEEPQPDPLTTIATTSTYRFATGESANNKQFSGGVAWATLLDSVNHKIRGVINTHGELIYMLDDDMVPQLQSESGSIVATPFFDGLSVVYRLQTGMAKHSYPGFIIINDDGEEVYRCTDENIYYNGTATDGIIIALKHESGFTGDDWYYCIYDRELQELKDTRIKGSKINLVNFPQFLQLSDGFYYCNSGREFLNLNNGSCYGFVKEIGLSGRRTIDYLGYIDGNIFLSYFTDESKPVFSFSSDNTYGYLPESLLRDVSSSEELWALTQSDSFEKINNPNVRVWNNGSLLDTSGPLPKYTDLDGNTLFTFPSFPDGVKYKAYSGFSGGYIALYLIGVDEKGYVTLIDGNGTMQYDPVRSEVFDTYTSVSSMDADSENGYIFLYRRTSSGIIFEIVSPNGRTLSIGDDLSGLKGCQLVVNGRYYMAIGEDLMYLDLGNGEAQYYDLDGKTAIKTVVANYNIEGQLIFTNQDGNLSVGGGAAIEGDSSQNNTTSTAQQKSYVTLNNFSIEGKWKNVGSYTFGQVGNGGILTFDGTYCNLYSPRDTYALYQNGASYTLDTTSALGEPTSFTVKIVDKDNIDIYFGSNYLEMTRVG